MHPKWIPWSLGHRLVSETSTTVVSRAEPIFVGRHIGIYLGLSPRPSSHQHVQVPKMEVLNLIFGYFGDGFIPYISRIHTAYIGEDSSILGT